MKKRGVFVILALFVLVLSFSFSFVSAGFFNFFKQTGQVTSGSSWTQWYDIDGPSGKGDYETLQSIIALYPEFNCDSPINVECRVVSSGVDYSVTGQNVVCNPSKGFYCINNENSEECLDYEIRFLCSDELKSSNSATLSNVGENNLIMGGDEIKIAPFQLGIDKSVNFDLSLSGRWTQWYDRDNPDQEGFDGYDDETIHTLNKEGNDICGGYEAVDVEVKNVETGANWSYSDYLDYKSRYHPGSSSTHYHDYFKHTGNSDNIRTINPSEGFLCKGDLGDPCRDYAIRFKCGDEKVEKVYVGSTYWTDWINVDDPMVKGDHDDDETLGRIRGAGYDVCSGEDPIDIQAKNADSGATWTFSDMPPAMRLKEDFFKGLDNTDDIDLFSPTEGFHCNDVRFFGVDVDPCRDYEVRFLCKGFFEEVDVDFGEGEECSNLNCDSIYAGPGYSCVIDDSEEVCCWGLNNNEKLGTGKSDSQVIKPTQILGGKKFSELIFNNEFLCGIDNNGELYCWGRTSINKGLSLNDISNNEFSVLKFGLGKVIEVDSSESHLCAVTSSGELYCFGTNIYGQLAPFVSEEDYFGKVEFDGFISDVALFSKGINSNFGPSTAFISEGTLYVYGGIITSEIGAGRITPGINDNFISTVSMDNGQRRNILFSNVEIIDADEVLCALDTFGKISCINRVGNSIYAEEVDFGNNVFVSLSVIGENVCGLTEGGEVYCNSDKLTLNSNFQKEEGNYYVYHKGDFSFEDISASSSHVCGITNSGNAYCWKSIEQTNIANMLGGSDQSESAPLTKVDVCVDVDGEETGSDEEDTSPNETICSDTDGGINYLVKGTTVASGERDSPSTDVCTDLGYLREWYCYEDYYSPGAVGKITYETVNCSEDIGSEYICQDGACVKQGMGEDCRRLYFNYDDWDKMLNSNSINHNFDNTVVIYSESDNIDKFVFWIKSSSMTGVGLTDEEFFEKFPLCIRGYDYFSTEGMSSYEIQNYLEKECIEGFVTDEGYCKNLCADIGSREFPLRQLTKEAYEKYVSGEYGPGDKVYLDTLVGDSCDASQDFNGEKSSCMGCKLNEACYTFGFVKDGMYCSELDSEFVVQKLDGVFCGENYECSSGICAGSICVSSSIWDRFLNFFGKLF